MGAPWVGLAIRQSPFIGAVCVRMSGLLRHRLHRVVQPAVSISYSRGKTALKSKGKMPHPVTRNGGGDSLLRLQLFVPLAVYLFLASPWAHPATHASRFLVVVRFDG